MEIDRSANAKENLAPSQSNQNHETIYNQLESRYECPICLNWLQEPTLTTCGHRFCKSCISSWLEQSGHCPIDNIALNVAGDVFPDNYTRREILEKRTLCPYSNKGCKECLHTLELEAHIAVCPFARKIADVSGEKSIQCSFKHLGCVKQFHDENDLKHHVDNDIQQHLNLLANAFCELKPKSALSRSTSDAKEQEAMCLWDPNQKQKDGENDNHASSVNGLIRALYERVIVLEQRNREQDIVIGNMTRQLTSLSVNHHKFTTELPLRYCMGTHIWRIDSFTDELNSMILDPMKMLYSQGFYTSPYGYKFCARMNVSTVNSQCLSLHIHTMKSGHDDALDWPFSGRISFTMVNPSRLELSQKDTMMSRTELQAFQKPTSDICLRGFGFTEYALIDDLNRKGFIQSNTLIIKIRIQPV